LSNVMATMRSLNLLVKSSNLPFSSSLAYSGCRACTTMSLVYSINYFKKHKLPVYSINYFKKHKLPLHICNVPGSNNSLETGSRDQGLSWISTVHPGKCWNRTLKQDITAFSMSFPIHHT
jgi:hypothetical protein